MVEAAPADVELAQRASAGDQSAFAELYERYFSELHDFAYRTVRDQDSAADVVQSTFVKAWDSLQKRGPAQNVKSWLFTITRNGAIDELRRRRRIVHSDADEDEDEGQGLPSFVDVDRARLSDPEAVAQDDEIVELVWTSAAALAPKEYSLLDMHVRRGLSADELADCLGLRKGNIYTMLSRMRDSLEESVTSTLLVRRGREACSELDGLLERAGFAGGALSREMRQAVARHVQACERCQDAKRRFVSPFEIFAALAPIPAMTRLRDSTWESVAERTKPGAEQAGGAQERLRDALDALRGLSGRLRFALVAAVAIATLLAVFLALAGGQTALVQDPFDVRSTSHQPDVPSTENVVRIAWTRQSNVLGYSVLWSQTPRELPPAVVNLDGEAAGTASPPLAPGEWYFSLRTRGRNGRWTSTSFLGKFIIRSAELKRAEETNPKPVDEEQPAMEAPPAPEPTPTPSAPRPVVAPPAPAPTNTPVTIAAPEPTRPSAAPPATCENAQVSRLASPAVVSPGSTLVLDLIINDAAGNSWRFGVANMPADVSWSVQPSALTGTGTVRFTIGVASNAPPGPRAPTLAAICRGATDRFFSFVLEFSVAGPAAPSQPPQIPTVGPPPPPQQPQPPTPHP